MTASLNSLRVLLTSYGTGADRGRNIGAAGYSHDIVAGIYQPVLQSLTELETIQSPKDDLADAVARAYSDGRRPVQFSVTPLQDLHLHDRLATIAVPAWEFPDPPVIPDSRNPLACWKQAANQCERLVVSGPFTAQSIRSTGTSTPIDEIAVPVSDSYFRVPRWDPTRTTTLNCAYIELPRLRTHSRGAEPQVLHASRRFEIQRKLVRAAKAGLRHSVNKLLSPRTLTACAKAVEAASNVWAASDLYQATDVRPLELSGPVYTSIFNPDDGRKNWQDLFSSFLLEMANEPDVTLVVKLVTSNPISVGKILCWYRNLRFRHQCRVVMIDSYLSNEDMLRLTQASAFYFHTTRAEGNCLPLMDYMAAGRPGISPVHTAVSDYFDHTVGYTIDSHPEPSSWPHAPEHGLQTSWQRLVWPRIGEQLRNSLETLRDNPGSYEALAQKSQDRMRTTASVDSVRNKLRETLEHIANAVSPKQVAPAHNTRRAA